MEKKKNSTTKETGGGVERGDCKQVLRVSRSTTSLKGRPQWVQGFCGLPSVGIPGARAGLSEEWAFGGGGEDKGRAPEIPSRRPGGHSSHITERPSPVSSVCVCVSNAHVCVKHHEPRKGGEGGEGRKGRGRGESAAHSLRRERRSLLRHTHDAYTSRTEAADAGAEEIATTRHPRGNREENTLVGKPLLPSTEFAPHGKEFQTHFNAEFQNHRNGTR